MKKSELRRIIKEEIERLVESPNDDQIYVLNDELWYAYSPGSGQTFQLKHKSFMTNKPGHSHDNDMTDKIVIWSQTNKPISKSIGNPNNIQQLYKIPVYSKGRISNMEDSRLSVWGGDVKPNSYKYMLVSTSGVDVVTFFDNRNEARSWIESGKSGIEAKHTPYNNPY